MVTNSKKQRSDKIFYGKVVKSGKEHMNERLKQFTATTEESKEHTDLCQPVMWKVLYQNRLASKFIIENRNLPVTAISSTSPCQL